MLKNKKCKLCGHSAFLKRYDDGWSVVCWNQGCGYFGSYQNTETEALNAWEKESLEDLKYRKMLFYLQQND